MYCTPSDANLITFARNEQSIQLKCITCGDQGELTASPILQECFAWSCCNFHLVFHKITDCTQNSILFWSSMRVLAVIGMQIEQTMSYVEMGWNESFKCQLKTIGRVVNRSSNHAESMFSFFRERGKLHIKFKSCRSCFTWPWIIYLLILKYLKWWISMLSRELWHKIIYIFFLHTSMVKTDLCNATTFRYNGSCISVRVGIGSNEVTVAKL